MSPLRKESESSENNMSVNEELVFEYFMEGVFGGKVQGLEIPHYLDIHGLHLEGIWELDEEDDGEDEEGAGKDDDDILNFDGLPLIKDILELDEIPELIEIPNFEELPCFDVVPDPEGAPDVHDILNSGENLDYDFDYGPDFEEGEQLDLAEVPYLDVVPSKENAKSDADKIPGNDETPDIN